MKKWISVLLTLCMVLSLFSVAFTATAADAYETVELAGFNDWTQAELDTSSGNNGYANGCITKLTVVTDTQYIVGGGKQAIKAVKGGSQSYNNCIVNWTYGSGGPCTTGNVWAAANGSAVDYSAYEGIRVAVLNSKGEPANFTRVTFRVTEGKNYSNNMRYWDGTIVRDAAGYFYFDFKSFKSAGSPAGADIYDYLTNYAKGISMLCYGGTDENTCYYSAVELYRTAGASTVNKSALITATNKLEGYDSVTYAAQLDAANAVIDDPNATQEQVDAQLAIINACINEYKAAQSGNYTYVQMDGIQKWTAAEVSSMNGFGATYTLSDKGLVGDATQSIKMTATGANTRFCFATQKSNGSFSTVNPYQLTNAADGKLSDYDGIAIAVCDENGNEIAFNKFVARLMRDSADWGSYWTYEASYTDMNTCYLNGYYHLKFSDYPALAGVIDDLAVMSVLFYKDVKAGDVAYISDMKAYKVKETTDYSKLAEAIDELKGYNADGAYDADIAAAEAVLNDTDATQDEVDAAANAINRILRDLLQTDVDFDEDNIVMSFGAISDIHINGTVGSYNCNKYDKALQLLKKYAGGSLDAVTIAGDISSSSYDSSIGNAFTTITDNQLGEDANVFFISGNHDAQESQWDVLSQFYFDLSKYTENDLTSSRLDRGNRHTVINGYHYIGVNMMDYWNASEAMFADQDLEWLADELAAARADAPGQPIFVYVHAGVYGTTYGSDLYTGKYWGSKKIYDYLADYPEVVTFSGHVHFPLTDERTIYQKDFTSLNCGSVQYMAIESGYVQTGSSTTIDGVSSDISGGLLVQVDKNNNLKITRIDFTNDKVIKQPFYVSAPDMENESHLYSYNDAYFNADNTAPEFAADADISGKMVGDNMIVTFDAAADNDMVHHYVIEIVGAPSASQKSVKTFSEFYLYAQPEDFPESYTFSIPYTLASGDTAFEIAVYAVDSMGLTSEPITYESQDGDIPDDIDKPVGPNLFQNGDFEAGTTTGWSAYSGSQVETAAAKNGAFGMHAKGTGGWGTLIAQTVTVEAGEEYVLSFWYKTNSVGANIQVKQDNNSGAAIEGAGGWYNKTEWTYVEYKFTAPTDKIFFNVCGGGNGTAEDLYFDDIVLNKIDNGTPGEPAPDTGLVINGNFETGDTTGWSVYQGTKADAAATKTGSYGLHATGNGGWGTMACQTINVEAGEEYVMSFWYKTNSVGANIQVKQNDNSGAAIEGTGGWYNTTEWTYVEYTFTAPTDKVFFNVCGGGNGTAEDLYFDDVTLVKIDDGSNEPDTPDTPDEPAGDTGLVVNGNFETGDNTGWNLYQSTAVDAAAAKTGSYGLHIVGNGGWGGLGSQLISGLEIGKVYRISLQYKALANGVNIQLCAGSNDQGEKLAYVYGTNTDWTEFAVEFEATTATAFFTLVGAGNNQATEMYIDDVSITEVVLGGDDNDPNLKLIDDLVDHIKTQGRTSLVRGTLMLDFTASGIEFELDCAGDVYATFNASKISNSAAEGGVYFTIIVDGETLARDYCRISSVGETKVLLAEDLPAGKHTFAIYRQSEHSFGEVGVCALSYEGELLDKPADKDLYIEYIGDSITCGYGDLIANGQGGNSPGAALYSDGTQAYAYLSAQALNADWSIVSWSGLGCKYGYSSTTMQDVYPAQRYNYDQTTAYDFSKQPDVVVLALGTNDNSIQTDATLKREGLVEMLTLVREKNPNAPIVWVYGMMTSGVSAMIEEIVAEFGGAEAGYYACRLTQNNSGGGSHPSLSGQQQFADELVAFLKDNGLTETNSYADRISGGETSRTEETKTGLGLAFKFTILADGIAAVNGNETDLTNATINGYKLVEFGALASNDAAIGADEDKFNVDNLSGRTIKVAAKYLMELEEDSATYAVRVINIPAEEADSTIYARAYYVYEDADGNEVIVYDDIYSASYNG